MNNVDTSSVIITYELLVLHEGRISYYHGNVQYVYHTECIIHSLILRLASLVFPFIDQFVLTSNTEAETYLYRYSTKIDCDIKTMFSINNRYNHKSFLTVHASCHTTQLHISNVSFNYFVTLVRSVFTTFWTVSSAFCNISSIVTYTA